MFHFAQYRSLSCTFVSFRYQCSLSVSHSLFTFPPSSTFFLHTFSFYLYLSFPRSLALFFSMPSLPGLLATFWTPPSPLLPWFLSSPPPRLRAPTSLFVRLRLPLYCRHHYRRRFSVSPRYLNRLSRDAAIVDNAGEWERVLWEESGRFRISYPDTRTSGGAAALLCRWTFRKCGRVRMSTSRAFSLHRTRRHFSPSFFFLFLISISLSIVLSFVHCTVPVRRFLPNSVKCDFFGWSKKSLCDYILHSR